MQKGAKEYGAKEYMINRVTLAMIGIIILANILMGSLLDVKILTVVSSAEGVLSFLLTVVMVGLILEYNPPDDSRNCLVICKRKMSAWVEKHEHLKWLQGDKAFTFLVLYMGIIVGICGLVIRLGLDVGGL